MPASTVPLTLLTLNIHMGFASFNRRFVLPELRTAVHAVHADLVFLQETLGNHDRHAQRHTDWPALPQYSFLADTLWGNVAYGRNAVYPEGHHGNAVLSKFPILRWDNHDISIGGQESRGFLHCVIAAPSSSSGPPVEVHAICTHLGLRETHRQHQLTKLCTFIVEKIPATSPLLVAGDFNDWRRRASAKLAQTGLRDVFAASGGRAPRTFPVWLPMLPLDRIYSRGVEVIDSAVLSAPPWKHLSDHAGLIATVQP